MKKVSITKCSTYEDQIIEKSIEKLMEPLGGFEAFINKDEKVLIKPNLLMAKQPEFCVTTHPAVIKAVIKAVIPITQNIIIADSPGAGYPYTVGNLKKVYKTCGLDKVADETGVKLNYDLNYKSISKPDGYLLKLFDIIAPVLEADKIINVCKLKSHMFTGISCAVKNMFGAIPGVQKPGYHSKLIEANNFATMLLDLYKLTNPCLSIMDGIIGMEGDGPSAGTPKEIGLLMASPCAIALDAVLCKILGKNPETIPHIRAAINKKLISSQFSEIEILGVSLEDAIINDFVWPKILITADGFGGLPFYQKIAYPFFKEILSMKPIVDEDNCISCGVCEKACPVKAINMDSDKAEIDNKKCIRCYCCHELCPEKAVKLNEHFIKKLTGIK